MNAFEFVGIYCCCDSKAAEEVGLPMQIEVSSSLGDLLIKSLDGTILSVISTSTERQATHYTASIEQNNDKRKIYISAEEQTVLYLQNL